MTIPYGRTASVILVAMAVSCTQKMDENDVVSIDNRVFHRDEFFGDVAESRFVDLNPDARHKVLDEFVRRQIILMEAKERGLLDHVDTQKAEARMKQNLIVNKVLEEEVWTRLVSDSSLKLLYKRKGRRITVHHIMVTFKGSPQSKSDRSEEEALRVIEEIRDKIVKGEIKFYEAARRYSEDPSRRNDGVLGQFEWGKLFEPVQSAAFSMKAGEISEPLRSLAGYHLVRVTGIQEVPLPPYEDMIPELRRFIRTNNGHEFDVALRAFEKRLERRYAVKFNPEMIADLLRAIGQVHGDKEGYPRAKLIEEIEIPGIISVAGSVPIELAWFREQISILGPPLSNSLILSERTLVTTLEHVLYRHLTQKFAEQTRDESWFDDIDKKVEKNRTRILKEVLLDDLSNKEPDTPRDQLLEDLVNRHRVRVNTDFVSDYRAGETRI
ncbi:MAG: peptidylprolyl isomerase [Fidelibacterota bacterium]